MNRVKTKTDGGKKIGVKKAHEAAAIIRKCSWTGYISPIRVSVVELFVLGCEYFICAYYVSLYRLLNAEKKTFFRRCKFFLPLLINLSVIFFLSLHNTAHYTGQLFNYVRDFMPHYLWIDGLLIIPSCTCHEDETAATTRTEFPDFS